jgi:alkanesulfonate monooxygenase SsuD/methylene tetrahydromethanopterin reductase-like flavin-dependent oxidoreductase (luciferase family)
MKLGMLHLFENPAGFTEHEVVKNQMELMIEAERLGYDTVMPAEHHFSEYGYCASPQVSLAAVAARTSKIRLSTGVVVLPFHHPVRVAEDFAFIDLMSDGRVDLGVGRGYQPMEYKGFGVDQTRSREIFHEGMEVIRKAWTEDRFSYHGKHYQFDDLCVRPKPLQQPHPPVYMACLSPETFEIAGRYGYNIMMSTVFGLTADLAREGIANYRKGRKEGGFDPEGGKVQCLLMVYPGKTREEARKTFGPRVTWYYRTIAKYIAPPQGQKDVKGYDGYGKTRDLAATLEFDDLVDGTSIVCDAPEACVEKLVNLGREFHFDELLCWTRIGGLENAKVLSAMELLGTDILPAVRKLSDKKQAA